jgi:hypothetical protein
MTEQEQLSVCAQVNTIMENSFEQFAKLIRLDCNDDAIAIGDEFFEWMRDIDEETILFCNEHELKDTYKQLVKERKQK